MIRGITLTHPWAFCVAHGGKNVENRTWRPEKQGGRVGMYLAIHGGAVPGLNTGKREEARMDLAAALSLGVPTMPDIVPGAEAQAALLALSMGEYVKGEERFFVPGIVALAQVYEVQQRSQSPWAVRGQWHWELCNVVALSEPIPHRGAQGLWEVQPDALAKLREAYKGRAA